MHKSGLVLLLAGLLLSACSSLLPNVTPTRPVVMETLAASVELHPSSTEIVTVTPTAEPSPTSTLTPFPTPTVEVLAFAPSSVPAEASIAPRFLLQTGTPVGVANFVQPEAGCNWMGVGGQVFDLNDQPVTYLVVEVGGTLGGIAISQLTLSGMSTVLGPGGFLIKLADRPIASDGTLWMQLFDLSGQPLTEKTFFPTFAECERNFILINFREVSPQYRIVLPLIFK